MTWFTGAILYLLIWWTALFAVLPWGIRHDDNKPGGHAAGAPLNPDLKRKFLVTTAVAAIIWLAVFLLMKAGIIDFRGIAMGMVEKDAVQ